MRILQILPELNVGGVERGTVDLSQALIQRGHDSFVVSNGGRLVEDLIQQGAIHHALPVHKKNLFTIIDSIQKLKKFLEKEQIDIVHARSRIPALIAWFATRNTKIQFVTTCHGYYSQNFFSKLMGWGKRVIVVSDIIGRHMVEDFKVRQENIRLIPRSVDLNQFSFRPRIKGTSDFTVMMIGRMTSIKGYEFFLRAMAKVLRQKSFVRVRIVGDASENKKAYKESLLLLTEQLGISDKVEFLGNRSDIPDLLAQANVLVLPTVTQEAFGRVLVEAQAVGVSVIATKVGGIVDIVEHEKTGLLVMPKDSDGIANAILRLMEDTKLADDMISAARQQVEEKFTLTQMVEKTIAVYEEVLSQISILVIHFGSLSDTVQTMMTLKAIRQHYPQSIITVLSSLDTMSVLQRCPYLDEVLTCREVKFWKKVFYGNRLLSRLRQYHFDMILDLHNTMFTHFLSWAIMPRLSYGYDISKISFLLTHRIPLPKEPLSLMEKQKLILKSAGILYNPHLKLEFWPRREDEKYIKNLLHESWIDEKNHSIIGINLDDEGMFTKSWDVNVIIKTCDLLAGDGIRVVLTGAESCRLKTEEIIRKTKSKPTILIGKTNLFQMAALMKFLKVYLTPVSLPMYLSCAMKTPVITFMESPSTQTFPFDDSIISLPIFTAKSIHEAVKKVFTED